MLSPFACDSEAEPKNLKDSSGQAPAKNLAVKAVRSEILRGVYTERGECAQDDDSRAVPNNISPTEASLFRRK